MKISATIITLNEEKNISRCVNSIKSFCDEIIILDSYSTDSTKSICDDLPVKFFERKFTGYIDQKNHAASLATNDLIFNIDADEEVSTELQEEILNLKNNSNQIIAAEVNRQTQYVNHWVKYCGWFPDRLIRLYDRRHCSWEGELIHEKIIPPKNSTPLKLNSLMRHYSYSSIQDHLNQTKKFTTISAKQYLKQGRKTSFFHITLRPLFQFFRDYILKLGILDGKYGVVICLINSYSVYLKYSKLKTLKQRQNID